jgi:transposase
MTRRYELTDVQWDVLRPLLPTSRTGRPRKDDRRVINGILWRLRTGAPWRDVPERYGPWKTVYGRFRRWSQAGVWTELLRALNGVLARQERLSDTVCVDATYILAVPPSRGVIARAKGERPGGRHGTAGGARLGTREPAQERGELLR